MRTFPIQVRSIPASVQNPYEWIPLTPIEQMEMREYANGEGNEPQVGGVSHKLQISTSADKSLLNAAIASAHTKHDAAVEGNGHGL